MERKFKSFLLHPTSTPANRKCKDSLKYYPTCNQSIILNKTHPIAYNFSLIASKASPALNGQGTWPSLQSCYKCHLNLLEYQHYMNTECRSLLTTQPLCCMSSVKSLKLHTRHLFFGGNRGSMVPSSPRIAKQYRTKQGWSSVAQDWHRQHQCRSTSVYKTG